MTQNLLKKVITFPLEVEIEKQRSSPLSQITHVNPLQVREETNIKRKRNLRGNAELRFVKHTRFDELLFASLSLVSAEKPTRTSNLL